MGLGYEGAEPMRNTLDNLAEVLFGLPIVFAQEKVFTPGKMYLASQLGSSEGLCQGRTFLQVCLCPLQVARPLHSDTQVEESLAAVP